VWSERVLLTRWSVRHVAQGGDWSTIHDPAVGLLVERRAAPVRTDALAAILALPDAGCRIEGAVTKIERLLGAFGEEIAADVAALASRFADTMSVDGVRVRLEVVTTNACKRWHLDYTDVRLVTTYAGTGTEYRENEDAPAERLPAGAVALFKGRLYGEGHATVLHRSPPIEGTGERRLVLVIDTPRRDLDELAFAALTAGHG
jgi:hypothetical protein